MHVLIEPKTTGEWVIHATSTRNDWKTMVFSADEPLLVLLERVVGDFHSLEGVAVVVGVGRFTATRVACTVANTLASALAIPCVGVEKADLTTLIGAIHQAPIGSLILPSYSAPANIGGQK